MIAALFVLAGIAVVWFSGYCESECASDSELLHRAVKPVALTVAPLSPAVAMLFRWRGYSAGWLRTLLVAVVLAAYAVGACVLAWWLATQTVIYGDAAWVAFWALVAGGWVAAGLGLVRANIR